MRFDLVIFDMDGTVTEPHLDFAKIRSEIGLAEDCHTILEEVAKMSEAEQVRAHEIILKHERWSAEQSTLSDNAEYVFERLRFFGVKIAILTRNLREHAEIVFRKHGLYYDALIDRDDGPAKPDPYGVDTLLERFGVDRSRACLVGDYLHDLETAKAANVTAVLFRSHPMAGEFEVYADYCIDNLVELLGILGLE